MIMMMMMMMAMMTNTIPYRRKKNHIWDKVLMGIWVHPIIIITTITSKHTIIMITITTVITRWAAKADELSSELEQVILLVVAIYIHIHTII